MTKLSDHTIRNISEFILMKYKYDSLSPSGRPKRVQHSRRYSRVNKMWVPDPKELASCCRNKENTLKNPHTLLEHCFSRTHVQILIKEKPEVIMERLKLYLIPIEVFDIKQAPLYLNYFNANVRRIAEATLQGTYENIPIY